MFSFVARQAIFDENMNTVGYELLLGSVPAEGEMTP